MRRQSKRHNQKPQQKPTQLTLKHGAQPANSNQNLPNTQDQTIQKPAIRTASQIQMPIGISPSKCTARGPTKNKGNNKTPNHTAVDGEKGSEKDLNQIRKYLPPPTKHTEEEDCTSTLGKPTSVHENTATEATSTL